MIEVIYLNKNVLKIVFVFLMFTVLAISSLSEAVEQELLTLFIALAKILNFLIFLFVLKMELLSSQFLLFYYFDQG